MKAKTIPVTLFIAAGAVAVAAWMVLMQPGRRETAEPAAVPVPAHASEPPDATPALPHAPESPALPPATAGLAAVSTTAPPIGKPPSAAPPPSANAAVPAPAKTGKPKPPLHAPLARAAMSFVGVDPDAESTWLEAIFNPDLPAKEREDLIEDLNEQGLSDPKRPGPEDLPIILNRIVLIEKITPDADPFMLPHLREARKDLLNLAALIQGEGKPVR